MQGVIGLVALILCILKVEATVLATKCTVPFEDVTKVIFKPDLPYYELSYAVDTKVVMSCEKGLYLVNTIDNVHVEQNVLDAHCIYPGIWDKEVGDFSCSAVAPITCTMPKEIIGLQAEPPTTFFHAGTKVKFFCLTGYEISGPSFVQCESSGSFYPETPVCIPLCVPPKQDGLIVTPLQTEYTTGQEIMLSCEDGYKLTAQARRSCETSGKFFPEPQPGICIRLGCPPPQGISHGTYEPKQLSYKLHEKVTYSCHSGYALVGKSWMICHDNNKFIWSPPKCVEIYCEPPEKIPNAVISGELKAKYAIGEKIIFVCIEGYRFKSKYDSITCLLGPDGKTASFSEGPICEAIYCVRPEPLAHGKFVEVQETYGLGQVITYSCNVGYILEGSETAVCLQIPGTHRTSFTKPPVCRPARCRQPKPIRNGDYAKKKPFYNIGETVRYFCKSGYGIDEGDGTAKCSLSKFSKIPEFPAPPRCIAIRCNPPGIIVNGKYEKMAESYSIGETVTYQCDAGYVLVGQSTAICLAVKDIDIAEFTVAPICEEIKTCKPPVGIENGGIKDEEKGKKRYYIGDYVIYYCKPGYILDPLLRKSTCVLDEYAKVPHFTTPPVCTQMKCNTPEGIKYGGFKPTKKSYSIGETIQIYCDEGFVLRGPDASICLAEAGVALFTLFPVCKPITCKPPRPPPYGDYVEKKPFYTIGEYITYTCNRGYVIKGEGGRSTCALDAGGETASFKPRISCMAIRCKQPIILYGSFKIVKEFYSLGEIITYSCDVGYVLEGPKTSTCVQIKGEYLAKFTTLPICTRIKTCEPPVEIENGGIKGAAKRKKHYYIGDYVIYYCKPGYTLKPHSEKSTCVADEYTKIPHFTSPPVCTQIRCNRPSDIKYGGFRPARKYYVIGDTIQLYCDEGFLLQGPATAECLEELGVGLFTISAVCKPVTCKPPRPTAYGDYAKKKPVYSIGEYIAYTCDAGYAIKGNGDRSRCTLDEGGKTASFKPRISCMEIGCDKPIEIRYGTFRIQKEFYSLGETITHSCTIGFLLEGPDTSTCVQKKGEYVAKFTTPPICIRVKCSHPEDIKNGDFSGKKKTYFVNDIVSYTCLAGYVLKGSNRAQCKLNRGGKTASFTPAPRCTLIQCQTPEPILYGGFRIVKKYYNVGEKISYHCDEGFLLVGLATSECQIIKGRNEARFTKAPSCKRFQCDPPVSIPYGDYEKKKKKYNIDESVIYSCNTGYKLRGSRDRSICRLSDDGKTAYFTAPPQCIVMTCEQPEAPEYGRFEKYQRSYAIGDTVKFFCNSGFNLVGPQTATCHKVKDEYEVRFTKSPICKRVRCSSPEPIPYGDFEVKKQVYEIDEYVVYRCSGNYKLSGKSDTSVCRLHADGSSASFSPPPRCIEMKCDPPEKPEHGYFEKVMAHYAIGHIVEFFCDEGYLVKGSNTAICEKIKGKYVVQFTASPICIPIRCSPPDKIEHGDYYEKLPSYDVATVVTYKCEKGYKLSHDSHRSVCEYDKKTNSARFTDAPQCLEIYCGPPSRPKYGGYRPVKTKYEIEDEVQFYCDRGFSLSGSHLSTCHLPEYGYQAIFSVSPVCEEIRCGPPTPIPFGDYREKKEYYSIDEVVIYRCNKGYELEYESQDSSKCTLYPDGDKASFSDPPNCKEIYVFCTSPPDIDNGKFAPKKLRYDIDESVDYICDQNYKLDGKRNRATCILNKEDYTAAFTSAPACTPIECPPPQDIPNGRYVRKYGAFAIGEVILYMCDKGYQLRGQKLLTCTLNEDKKTGSFSGPLPTCVEIECEHPGPLIGGTITPHHEKYLYLDVIVFTCNVGYLLVGVKQARCEASGFFSAELPICRRKKCNPIIATKNVVYEPQKNEYYFDEKITFSCNHPCRTLYGPATAVCKDSWEFDGPVPHCKHMKICDTVPTIPWYGSIQPLKRNYTCGELVTFSCSEGTTLVGNEATICLPNGEFSKKSPVCEVVTCEAPKLNEHVYILPKYDFAYAYKSKIEYNCFWGFEISGDSMAVCEGNGQFSKPSPKCIPLFCDTPEAPEHGSVLLNGKTSFAIGDKVYYECDTFYHMEGEHYNKCNMFGKWEHGPPQCLYPNCKNNCFQRVIKNRPCQCDGQCLSRGDCCVDFTSVCGRSSCQGRCGTPGSPIVCACDSSCLSVHGRTRCCSDYLNACRIEWYGSR